LGPYHGQKKIEKEDIKRKELISGEERIYTRVKKP
jgi:hypothetical protein